MEIAATPLAFVYMNNRLATIRKYGLSQSYGYYVLISYDFSLKLLYGQLLRQ